MYQDIITEVTLIVVELCRNSARRPILLHGACVTQFSLLVLNVTFSLLRVSTAIQVSSLTIKREHKKGTKKNKKNMELGQCLSLEECYLPGKGNGHELESLVRRSEVSAASGIDVTRYSVAGNRN